MSQIEYVKTDPITGGGITATSELCSGKVMEWRIDVRDSTGAASANTCDIVIKDNLFERTLLTKTGVTGLANFFAPGDEWMNASGVAQDLYKPFVLISQRFTVTVTNGTNTDYLDIRAKIL
jgi:hypothetical protein